MATRKKKSKKRPAKSPSKSPAETKSAETRSAEAMTVAWTVTVTTVLLCNLASVAVHFYVTGNPAAKKMLLLQELLLFAGAMVGIISLGLLPVVFKVRKVPPPIGLVAFAVCVAGAPIVALLARMLG